MEPAATPANPVLHYIAVVRAARDFGLEPARLDTLALRHARRSPSPEALAEAVADALLGRI